MTSYQIAQETANRITKRLKQLGYRFWFNYDGSNGKIIITSRSCNPLFGFSIEIPLNGDSIRVSWGWDGTFRMNNADDAIEFIDWHNWYKLTRAEQEKRRHAWNNPCYNRI